MPTLAKTIFELSRIFRELNQRYYNSELESPLITVQSRGKRPVLGWCTNRQIWKKTSEGEKAFYEINISAEYINRNSDDIIELMLHEMAHLYGTMTGVKTTSRAGLYHNKKYKQIAETHGLQVSEDIKYGWCVTRLDEKTKADVQNIKPNKQAFKVYRENTEKPKSETKKSSTRKYICTKCGNIIRATKEVNIICGDCQIAFELCEA